MFQNPRLLQIGSCQSFIAPRAGISALFARRYSVSNTAASASACHSSRGLQDYWPAIRAISSLRVIPQASPLRMPTKIMACLTSAHKSLRNTSCCDFCFLQKCNPTVRLPVQGSLLLSPGALARPQAHGQAAGETQKHELYMHPLPFSSSPQEKRGPKNLVQHGEPKTETLKY